MSLHTPLCDILGIKVPILLAGMGGVSYAELCAAVSNAGGLGTLGMAGRSPKEIREEIKKTRDLTDKPFGVDLLAAVPESLERTADTIIEGGAKAFISGLGVPPPHLVKKLSRRGAESDERLRHGAVMRAPPKPAVSTRSSRKARKPAVIRAASPAWRSFRRSSMP